MFKNLISGMTSVELVSAIKLLMHSLWLVTNLFDVCWIKKAQLQIAIKVLFPPQCKSLLYKPI